MSINILDSMIINRISAGEVVESPFSIVKELLDNAIDAGADKINISIKNGGIDSIVVKDNGKGIEYDDIKKALLPHATSKITNIDDLENIQTLGFRGEALASISNVSQTTLTTKTENSDCAYTIDVFGGTFSEITPCSAECGTKIEVNNLFYNTPARRKFLKKPKQEENQITNIVSRYILSNPTIKFKYTIDNKTIYQTKGNGLFDAICCVYNEDISQNLLKVEKSIGNIKLTGYVSKIGYSKPNTSYQTLILNSRYVIDEIVSKATYMAFEEYLMPRQFPVYIFNIDMPTVDVDVNVHPSKMNIKFENPSKIYDLVYSAVRSAIFNYILPNKTEENKVTITVKPEESLIKTDLNSLQEVTIEPNTSNHSDNNFITLKQERYAPITLFDKEEIVVDDTKVIDKVNTDKISLETNENFVKSIPETKETVQDNFYQSIHDLVDYKIVGEIFNEFIILEKGDNMLLLDFHAGHERLNYDKFTEMVKKRDVVVQDLLIPYTQDMTETEVEYILNLKEDLMALGFDIDSFGDKKIIIHSVPMQLKDINLKAFVDDMLHDMKNLHPSLNNQINTYLMQKACKSSVKSGMSLTESEIKDLLKDLDMKHPVLLCPHGRPVLTVVSRSQIEKWFKRIV